MTGTCPRYGVKTFNVETGQNITVQIARNTRRCVALFRVGCVNLNKINTKYIFFQPRGTCGNLIVTCDRFNLPNTDAHMCRRGDVMYVKPDEHNPRPYCLQDFPVYNYPGMRK